MADVVFTDPFGLCLENAETVLANVTAFRTWVSAADAAAAKASIYLVTVESPARPFVEMWHEDARRNSVSTTTSTEFGPDVGGRIVLRFEAIPNVAYAADFQNEAKSFMHDVYGIMDGLAALAGVGAYLNFSAYYPVDSQPSYVEGSQGSAAYWVWNWALDLSDGQPNE